MNNVRTLSASFIVLLVLIVHLPTYAQNKTNGGKLEEVSLDDCYQWARENYPALRQLDIIDRTTQFSLANASNNNLPQVALNGQASYQSEVTSFPIDLPNLDIPTIDKDQYKVYLDVYQPLSNFGKVKANKDVIANNGLVDKQQVEVDLYKLKERINQLYFGILLINEKITQFEIIQSDLDSALAKVNAGIQNGTATAVDRQLLQVEKLSVRQQIDENRANQTAFLQMLAILTNKNISEATELTKPVILDLATNITRPELDLFDLQRQSVLLQTKQVEKSLLPNLGLFAQGGYGRPALNFLSNDFDFYYIAGLRFNWNLSSLYNYKNTKSTLALASDRIASLEESFILNTNLTQSQQAGEVDKFQSLLASDNEIIKLREEVLENAKVKLSSGLITSIDYVRYLNDLGKARQMRILHETQLLLAQHNLKITTGH